jgi:hypothetical protein
MLYIANYIVLAGHPFNQEAITHYVFGILLSIMILFFLIVLQHGYACVWFEGNQSMNMAVQGAFTHTHTHTLVADVTR